jgi:hypothetical protein
MEEIKGARAVHTNLLLPINAPFHCFCMGKVAVAAIRNNSN